MLDTAESMKEIAAREIKKVPTLRGKTVVNLFYEASTRTRTSFEIAGKWLSADVINFSASGSSAEKGESLLDTAKNIEAMSPDVVVVRHKASGAPALLARHLKCAVVNAGDGAHEHPTQALLDLLTIREKKGHLDGPQRRHRRRRHPQPRGALEHPRDEEDGHDGDGGGAADADPGRPARSWASRSAIGSRRRSPTPTSIMMLRLQHERMTGRLHPVRPRVLARVGADPRAPRSTAGPTC